MQELQQFKCPCCNGAIAFDSKLQKMKCPYCDTEFEPETLKALDEDLKGDGKDEMSWDEHAGSDWRDGESDGIVSYSCSTCGGEIIGDATLAASSCPYCGNPVVIKKQFAGMLRPDLVIPFQLDKKAAKQGMMNHLKGKKLLNKVFKDENHIDEVKGMYVPFWLFDTQCSGRMRFRATKTRHWSDSDYDYTETSFYSVVRAGSLDFADVPVDGSEKMPNDLMESLEPFYANAGVDFQTAYLAGYFADRYDVDEQNSISRANDRIRNSTETILTSTVRGYTTVKKEASSVRFSGGRSRYALYPVWLLNTTWRGQKYIFAMNGQTGKFVGDLPVDPGQVKKWLFGVAGAVAGAAMLVQLLLWLIL